MRTGVDVARVHAEKRAFHDQVEADLVDRRMGIRYDERSTLRERPGQVPGVAPAVEGLRRACGALDDLAFNRLVPRDLRVSMKFSARRPQAC